MLTKEARVCWGMLLFTDASVYLRLLPILKLSFASIRCNMQFVVHDSFCACVSISHAI